MLERRKKPLLMVILKRSRSRSTIVKFARSFLKTKSRCRIIPSLRSIRTTMRSSRKLYYSMAILRNSSNLKRRRSGKKKRLNNRNRERRRSKRSRARRRRRLTKPLKRMRKMKKRKLRRDHVLSKKKSQRRMNTSAKTN